jgi:hypothetical protein
MGKSVEGIYDTFINGPDMRDQAWDFQELIRRIIGFFHLNFIGNSKEPG